MQYWFSLIALLFAGMIHAQVPGSIRVPATPSVNPLNPNGDGFITSSDAAFAGPSDETQFEIPFIAVQQYEYDPASDNQFAAGCQFYELVNDAASGADAGYYYYKDPDGVPLNGDELMIFRFRVARFSNGATAFSFLLDTDYRFGFTGPEADPNAVAGNPGFEKEVVVFNNTGATGGVRVFNVDGTANATIVDFYAPTSSHYQVANALNNAVACASDVPVFVDMYVPFSALGIASTQQVRMAVAVNEDIASSLGGGASDIGGIDGTLLPNDDDQFIKLINGISPVGITDPANRAPVASDALALLDEHSPAGTVVHAISAIDVNGDPLTYSISGGNTDNTFVINPATGVIQVNDPAKLNFETASQFQLTITVSDGRLYDNAIITVQLRNVNEGPSVEDETLYIDENAVTGTLIHTMTGSDPDAGATLSYSIVSGNTTNIFSINEATGALTTNASLDYELANTFNLVIRVSDGVLTDDATIAIQINNVNEVPVVSDATVDIEENSPSGLPIMTVVAMDPDAGSSLQFSIVEGNPGSTFTINALTGEISVDDPILLNFEVTPSFALKVRVSDGTLVGEALIVVDLKNVNESPTLEDAEVFIDENTPKETPLFTMQAADPDAVSQLYFTITSGNEDNIFSIDNNGEVKLATDVLDFEFQDTFNLNVQVSDGIYSAFATLVIHINDVNEAPIMEGGAVQLSENLPAGSLVYTVAASDPDAGTLLQYSIADGNSADGFAIDAQTGSITVNNPDALDFETHPEFYLTVVSSDGALSADAIVVVTLSDANEAPVVEQASVELQQPLQDNEIVYRVVARDQDADDILTFAIESQNGEVAYTLDPVTGDLSIPDASLYVTRTTSTDLIVTATDGGGLSGSALIQINLLASREVQIHPRKGFSPNGDGENDFWFIEGIEAFPGNTIQIFNRWGVKVFEINGYDNAQRTWTGEIKNASSRMESTYFYIITIPESEPISGYVISKP